MNETTDTAILAPLWRFRWLILAVGAIVAVASYAYYKGQPRVYSASTQVDLGAGSEAQQLISGTQPRTNLSSRTLGDAAAVITSSAVSEAAHARLLQAGVPSSSLEKVRAKAASESDFVTITAEAHKPLTAVALANDYAVVYVERQRSSYRRQVEAAIASARRQLHRIETAPPPADHSGKGASSRQAASAGNGSNVVQEAGLASKINQLESALALSSVQQVNPATSAALTSPSPVRNAIFGLVLGLLAATIAVFAVTRFDRRIHSLEQIEAIFKVRILTVLPKVKAPIVLRDSRPTPADDLLEPLRRLHTSLQLGDMIERDGSRSPGVLLFLSPDAGDGKSTLVANLALVQRDAGARVAVVEADLRQPVQAGLLGASAPRGLADVLAGGVSRDGAMQSVGAAPRQTELDSESALGGVSTITSPVQVGSLSVLVSGRAATNPPALLASAAMRDLVRLLALDYDYVLIDAPPPLEVSDAMPLLQVVDGIVIVARSEHTHDATARRLSRLLADTATAPVLGVVANGVRRSDVKRYGFASAYSER